jgi:hypothetical protein
VSDGASWKNRRWLSSAPGPAMRFCRKRPRSSSVRTKTHDNSHDAATWVASALLQPTKLSAVRSAAFSALVLRA